LEKIPSQKGGTLLLILWAALFELSSSAMYDQLQELQSRAPRAAIAQLDTLSFSPAKQDLEGAAEPGEEGSLLVQDPMPWTDRRVQELAGALNRKLSNIEAIAAILELQRLEPEVNALPALRDAYLKAAWSRRGSGELRALARYRIAQVEWRRGRRPKADKWIRTLGFIRSWALLGPLPERAQVEGSEYPDWKTKWPSGEVQAETVASEEAPNRDEKKGETKAWRELDASLSPFGRIELGQLVDSSKSSRHLLRAVIEVDEETRAYLRFGTACETRIFVNGISQFTLSESEAAHPARLDQYLLAANLNPGENELLVELTGEGNLDFQLRITEADGDRLAGVRESGPLSQIHPQGRYRRRAQTKRPVGNKEAPTTLQGIVDAAINEKPSQADLHAVKAWLQEARPRGDSTQAPGLQEMKIALDLAGNRREAARYALALAGWTRDVEEERRLIEQAMSLDSTSPEIEMKLAEWYLRSGRDEDAMRHLQSLNQRTQNYLPAWRLLASLEGQLLGEERELMRVKELFERWPNSRIALLEKSRLLRRDHRPSEALELNRVASGLYPGDDRVTAPLVSLLLQTGYLEDAILQFRALISYQPTNLQKRIELADLLTANGRPSAAKQIYDQAIALSPFRVDFLRARGSHSLLLGDEDSAREDLRLALKLEPHDAQSKALLKTIGVDPRERLPFEFLKDGAGVVELGNREILEGRSPNLAKRWVLLEQNLTQLMPSGLASRLHQEIHLSLTQGGADELESFSIPYTPLEQNLKIVKARIIRKNGEIEESSIESEQSLSDPQYKIYYDERVRIIRFSNLNKGDAVEIIWRLDDVNTRNWMDGAYSNISYFQDPVPVLDRREYLVSNGDTKLYIRAPDLPQLEQTERELSGGRSLRGWIAKSVPPIVLEAGMPGWIESAAYLHVSTFSDWGQVATWWWKLIEGQLKPTAQIKSLASQLVIGIPETKIRERVYAVHRWVVRNTRYVGLEFGVHGFKPYRVDQIYQRRYGDCKDKASIMHALLESLGIESRMVIVRTIDNGLIPESPASLSVFNHAILYVPELNLFLDGTAEDSGPEELPSGDRGAAVLILDEHAPENSVLSTLPFASPDKNRQIIDLNISIELEGFSRMEVQTSSEGVEAPAERRKYEVKETREKILSQSWAKRFPGIRITDSSFEGIESFDTETRIKFSARSDWFVRGNSSEKRLNWNGEGQSLLATLAPQEKRVHDLVLQSPWRRIERFNFSLPTELVVGPLPKAIHIENSFGFYSLVWSQNRENGNALTLNREIWIKAPRVETDNYGDFRSMLIEIDKAERAEILLTPSLNSSQGRGL